MTSTRSDPNSPDAHHNVDEIQLVAIPSLAEMVSSYSPNGSTIDPPRLSESAPNRVSFERRTPFQDIRDILQPISPPSGHPQLNFRPVMLQHWTTITLVAIFLLTGSAIAALLACSGSYLDFRVPNNYIYFTAQYVPSIIGTLTVMLFESFVAEFHLMSPYFSMADHTGNKQDGARIQRSIGLRYFPIHWFFPVLSCNITLLADFMTLIVGFSIVPAKASLLTTQIELDETWIVFVNIIPAVFLICGYSFMAAFTLGITIHLWDREKGLKWYPAALADQLVLFRNPDTLSYFAQLEMEDSYSGLKSNMFDGLRFRLGYWDVRRAGCVQGDVWYGIGVIDHRRSQELQSGTASSDHIIAVDQAAWQTSDPATYQPQEPNRGSSSNFSAAQNPTQDLCNCGGKKCEHNPHQFGILCSRNWIYNLWSVIIAITYALCLYIMATGLIHRGFLIPRSISSSDLLCSLIFIFLPTLLAGLLVDFFTGVKIEKSFTQSFSGMRESAGSASETILLEYLTELPVLVPLYAFQRGHWNVAWFSLLHFVSPVFPILVGGIVTWTGTGTDVKLHFGMPSFSTTVLFLNVYAISIFFARPTDNRLLPRVFNRLMDLMPMCHASKFLWRPGFDISDPQTTRDHMVAKIFLQGDKYRLGVYKGVDEMKHVGFDMVGSDVELLPKDPDCVAPALKRRWWAQQRGTVRRSAGGDV